LDPDAIAQQISMKAVILAAHSAVACRSGFSTAAAYRAGRVLAITGEKLHGQTGDRLAGRGVPFSHFVVPISPTRLSAGRCLPA
jgi:hypothetical protein